jgi:bifunctional UDP-N-acetylglucosamine pyrophosphorylase/glucosamine-1-phosphate N-acetyltransferase
LAAALAYDEDAIVVVQDEQLGTAQAVQQAKDSLAGFSGDVIVLYGDTPFIQPETLDAMLSAGYCGRGCTQFAAADPGRTVV